MFFYFLEENGNELFCVHVTFTPAVEELATVDIKTVAISAASFNQQMLSADALWKEIDDVAVSLSALETFYFLSQERDVKSKEDILYVHSEIVAKNMPKLRDSSKVRYGIEVGNGPSWDSWEWARADISSGDSEEGPKCKLIGMSFAQLYENGGEAHLRDQGRVLPANLVGSSSCNPLNTICKRTAQI